jgi:signal transduction histidine kinase
MRAQEAAPRDAVLDALPAKIALLDNAGRIVFLNRGWRRFAHGSGRRLGLGLDYAAFCREAGGVDPASAARIGAALAEILDGRRGRWEGEYPSHGRAARRWFRCLAAPVGPKARGGAVVAHFDITAQKLAEEARETLEAERRQASKMAALGTFAGGIAHDFNNLLLAMAGLVDRGLAEAEPGGGGAKRLLALRQAVEQAGMLVRQILAFARRDRPRRERLDLAATIARTLDLVEPGLPRRIAVERRIEGVGAIEADPVQLQQIVLNLLANARDAIGGRPRRIAVALERVPARGLRRGMRRVAHARLVVADDGAGIAPDLLDRVFEPFFTTKPPTKGIGMGLPVVHGIVSGHGGRIEVESRPGEGARFTVWLPLAARRAGS